MVSRTKSPNQLLSAARAYAERGWPVFPLVPGEKRPLTEKGLHDATTDRNTILEWWQLFPDANVGIATGRGCDVLDIDSAAAVQHLQSVLGRDYKHDGPVARTGKGRHLFFAPLDGARNRAGLFEGTVDYRGAGGYVVGPPSRHPSGRFYAWDAGRDASRPLPAVPPALADIIIRPTVTERPTAAFRVGGLTREDNGATTELLHKGGIILARPDIYEVVEQQLHQVIVQHGALWATVCIFHPDHNPSMVLYPDDTFHCYSCEAHGDSLDLQVGVDKNGKKRI